MSDKKKVIVFTTGGTIAMKFDPKVNGQKRAFDSFAGRQLFQRS